MESQSESTQTVSTLKLPMLKTRDYDLWSMRMEQYLAHTDYSLWEVIVNGDAPAAIASVSGGAEAIVPPKTAKQQIAKRNELKAKSTLLLAIPDEHLLKFHGIKDAKILWEAINTSQLEIHGEVIPQEDVNLKLLRSLPSAWNTHSLIMRNKSDLDTLSMDDLYNNLKVYEAEIKGQSSSRSNSQNVAFVSSDNTSSTNEAVNTAYDVSAASSQGQASASTYADDGLLNVTTVTGEVTLLENTWHQGIRGIEMEIIQEGLYQWRLLLMPWLLLMGWVMIWSYQAEEGPTNFALMAHSSLGSSSSSSLDTKSLKSVRRGFKRKKDDLKLKLEKFETSSIKLTKLVNSQISVNNKIGVGFDSQMNENELPDSHMNKSKVFESASDSSVNESAEDNNQVNDRYKAGEGYHVVPPPYTENFMPLRPDLSFSGLDDSVFKFVVSETVTSVHETETSASKKENTEKPKTVRSSAPLIEE
ncbi:hypothetical protein Tco_0909896 [Tanacetum coccineum]|uniref:Uncharacterized protein n=1 Tax=Tanacetum coccineum TaxID=301880 RepID=A0ABQ5CRC2_9ASTR